MFLKVFFFLQSFNMAAALTPYNKTAFDLVNLFKFSLRRKKRQENFTFVTIAPNNRSAEVLRPDFSESSACPSLPPDLSKIQDFLMNNLILFLR